MLARTGPVIEDLFGWRMGGVCAEPHSSPRAADAGISSNNAAASWCTLRPLARAYVGSVSAAGLGVVAYVAPQITGRDAALFAALAVLALIVSFAKVRLRTPRSTATVTACCIIDFTTLLVLGLPSATMTAAVGVWSQLSFQCRRPTPPYQMWFSVGAVALAIQASGRTFALVAGPAESPTAAWLAAAVIAAAAVHFLINSVLVAGAIGLSTEQRVFQVWLTQFAWIWPGQLFGFSVAAVAAAAIGWSHLALIPFAAALFALTYRNLKAYVEDSTESLTDPLTSLPNRRYLTTHAPRELSRSAREGAPMSVMLIDLDNFKAINDTYGHDAGDRALREVAQRLQQSIRSYDMCTRYGGDEFVAVLPGCDAENAARKADALQRAVADPIFEVKTHVTVPLRISVGVSTFPLDGQALDELLAVADTRMFSDKGRRATPQSRPSEAPIQPRPAAPRESERELREQLMQAQKMAAVGQLTASVAHDFNNALTAILGFSELVAERIDVQQAAGRDVTKIVRAARHAAGLAQWLLKFSRKESLPVSSLDINDVVKGIEPILRRLLGEGINITTELDRSNSLVRANPTQLEQVLINLAVNARDAMPRGGTLRIETSNKVLDSRVAAPMKAGSYAVLSISDTGVGMTPEVRARILEPFFTTKDRGRSTGLGLTVVANIVAESGGHLVVDSQEGRGTSFTIYLPTAERLAEQPAQSMPLMTSSIPTGAETVLVVEDEKPVREFVRAALTRHGYRVIDVDSAEAALAIADRDDAKIDLLLIDIKLPGVNGKELAASVLCRRPLTPVIFMTGCLDLMKGENEGSDSGILEKPFTVGALLSRTRAALDHRDHTKKPHHSLHVAASSSLPAVLAGWRRSDGPLKSESQFRARRGLSQAF